MATQVSDPVQYKKSQEKQFDAAAAGWRRWWAVFEGGGQLVSDRLVELAAVELGHRVLDVATGIGEPALTAARRVGPSGSVLGTDISSQMLEIARDRAEGLSLANTEFQRTDAEDLDLVPRSFDAVLCRWGLMFLPDPASALERMRRLLTPGGRLAASIWATTDKVSWFAATLGVIKRNLEVPRSPHSLFALAAPGALEETLINAGFSDVKTETLPVSFAWDSIEDFIKMNQDTAPVLNILLSTLSEPRRTEIWQLVGEEAQRLSTDVGEIRLENNTTIVVSATA